MTDNIFPCPCCGFLEFNEPPGSYSICSICGWEDDHVQLAHPFMRGGANGGSLFECQQVILKKIPAEVSEYEGQHRVSDWRPLTEADYPSGNEFPKTGLDYFFAAADTLPEYYWKKTNQ
jgi:hypothetical protein